MSATNSPAQQRPRRTRKSIAHFPSSSNPFEEEHGDASTKDGGNRPNKKSRSKSLGPGGLEALKEGNGNAQRALPAIRSILKPTIPISPPRMIPPRTPKTAISPRRNMNSASPARRTRSSAGASPRSPGKGALLDSTSAAIQGALVALRTEEDQQKAAREREKQEAIRRRDERRKSLANRRVSFAPEATLHTWDVVELGEDATTSSEATNSTRRHSTGNTLTANFTHGTQHAPDSDMDPPSTPPAQESSSPEHQRDVHQKKRRRSSTLPQMRLDDTENLSSSPTSSIGDDTTQQSIMSAGAEEEEGDDISDTDTYRDEETTAMDIDEDDIAEEDNTGRTESSGDPETTSSSSSSGQLEARLRMAVEQANTQNLSLQEMDQIHRNESLIDADFAADQMNEQQGGEPEDEDEDDGMEMTEAVGEILDEVPSSPFDALLPEPSPKRRSGRIARRRSSGVDSNINEETMDFTEAVGAIRRGSSRRESAATVATEDEDMSMELTNVVGGVLGRIASNDHDNEEVTHDFQPDLTAQMDMTMVYGKILSPVTERTELSTEASVSMDFTTAIGQVRSRESSTDEVFEDATATMTMDVTKAIGEIFPNDLQTVDKTTAKLLMEEEAEHGQIRESPLAKQPLYPTLPPTQGGLGLETDQQLISTTPTQSPRAQYSTPTPNERQKTPLENALTPTNQMTPQLAKPSTPSKTPPNRNVAMRRSSPRKLFSRSTGPPAAAAAAAPSPSVSSASKRQRRATVHHGILPEASTTPQSTTPLARRHSGEGVDQPGLGSPRVAELLDRRTSIGESAKSFLPQSSASKGVQFADPREMEDEVDKERANDIHRESGRELLEREVDEQPEDRDTTANLLGMIQSMTPKKGKKKDLKGRKSLAVGSARGLLGKRPTELDEEDEDDSPKRVKGPEHSPVKSIRLPAPPSKAETTGRLDKLARVSLGLISGNVGTPVTADAPSLKATPQDQARFRNVNVESTVPPVSFNQRVAGISPDPEPEPEEAEFEPLQLQDFLNLINVRFMDLETSKRRHTMIPQGRTSSDNLSDERELENCVAAGVSTVPMLELYQHSCRELKKYISEGRNIVREIERDTFEENPALFREYVSAAPDMRIIMDNQFKNVKTHARLLSKSMWYEWRMKLLDGLQDGLVKISEDLDEDEQSLSKQEDLLQRIVPGLNAEHQTLDAKEKSLRKHAEELASCDQDELKRVRQQLIDADSELQKKKKLLAEMQAQKASQDASLARLGDRKQQCITEIESSKQLCDEYRGWKPSEVVALRAEVESLEKASGWSISTATDDSLVFCYRKTLSLLLNPSSFKPATSDPGRVSLSLVSDEEPSTHDRFFLQLLRARLHALDQASTPLRDVLALVARGWDLAARLRTGVDALALGFVTDVAITGDDSLAVSASILLRQMQTRVVARFDLAFGDAGADAGGNAGGQSVTSIGVATKPSVKVIYGEELKEGRMGDFLAQKIAVSADEGAKAQGLPEAVGFAKWADAVRELETRLIARGKKEKAG